MKKFLITEQQLNNVVALINEGKFDLQTKTVVATLNSLHSLPEGKEIAKEETKKTKK